MSYNGNNVPDDCRYSNHWDDTEIECPMCGETMTLDDNNEQATCDNEECKHIIEFGDDDPEPPEDDFF